METKYTDLIERHFNDLLNQDEVKRVKELLANDKSFQKEYELFKSAQFVVELNTLRQLKENARKLDIENTAHRPKTNWILMAASVLLIAIVGTLFFSQNNYSNENLFNKAYFPADDYISDLGSDETRLGAAMRLYNTKQYPEAVGAFTTIELSEPQNQIAKFYLGQSLLQMDQMEQAIKTLDKVSGDYWSEAKWYVALALLKQGKEAEAKKILLDIMDADEDEAFVLKAERLQNKMNSPLRKFVTH
ncbi:MAG: hypothetical protein COA58_09950 [Bacteroidetes bacterium]|nr:MAG: hypothetical protein COA58_09950 [Bacteroidota bacterium]